MIFENNIKYDGKIIYGKQELIFAKASVDDVKQIAQMYKNISINYDNYRIKLNPQSKDSFINKGGMFIIFNETELKKEILNKHSFWALIKDNENNIIASFWFADNNDYFNDYKYNYEGKNIYPREIIVSDKCKFKDIAKILYYTVFYAMEKLSYTCSICDVYKVIQYEADDKICKTNMVNKKSFKIMLDLKGNYIGTAKVREIRLNKLNIWIEPQIFFFEYKVTLPYYYNIMQKKGIKIIWR